METLLEEKKDLEKAIEAIEKSVQTKWRGIRDHRTADKGCRNCELCQVYKGSFGGSDDCETCPIFIETGETLCQETPYEEWERHQKDEHFMAEDKIIHCQECADICDDEIDFLATLLNKKRDELIKVEQQIADGKTVYHIDPTKINGTRFYLEEFDGVIKLRIKKDGISNTILEVNKDGYRLFSSIMSMFNINTDGVGKIKIKH